MKKYGILCTKKSYWRQNMATVFNVQKFCVNDGPGIRTTVFIKGCPLNCLWCHNPESKNIKPELLFRADKCTLCGRCVPACPQGCHEVTAEGHVFNREKCISCGKCTDTCFADALEIAGKEWTADEVIKEVMKDEAFYKNSGGGMTLSGGEPMLSFDFTMELLKKGKEKGLHICMETCGFADSEKYKAVAPYVDIFLWDYKITNSEEHKKYTGVPNDLILKNLFMLDEMGAKTILRCPIIPTVNDTEEHFSGIADTANKLKNIIEVNVEPYHPLGKGKSEQLGKEYALTDLTFPEKEKVEGWIAEIASKTNITVKKA
jgi:pyruvate formate lyase activating enzyme